MTDQELNQLSPDTNRIGSRMSRINPDIFRNQSGDTSEESTGETTETEENVFSDEPINDEGQPTDGSDYTSSDHRQDDHTT